MKKMGKILIVIALVIAVAVVILVKQGNSTIENSNRATEHRAIGGPTTQKSEMVEHQKIPTDVLPRLVDVGASKCIPCKMMAPILEELKKEYAGKFDVLFVDVWKNPKEGQKYGIRIIPTQIFYDASGKERFRHEGFMSKDDILARWRELGVNLL